MLEMIASHIRECIHSNHPLKGYAYAHEVKDACDACHDAIIVEIVHETHDANDGYQTIDAHIDS